MGRRSRRGKQFLPQEDATQSRLKLFPVAAMLPSGPFIFDVNQSVQANMSDDRYAKAIQKTGFILEYNVADILRQAGWTVISNKYYEDDLEGSVREIDLLAYKVSKTQQTDIYTTLLISCKKSDADIWALLARDINLKDPNASWWPLHLWSNDKAIVYEIGKPTISKSYHDHLIALGVKEALSIPEYEVFAFQEMNRVSGAPHNDKNIFSAVTSLLKAQAGLLPVSWTRL